MSFVFGAILVSLGYVLGAKIGKLAFDEVEAGPQYFVLVREACVLAAVALVAFLSGVTLQFLAPLALLGAILFWRNHTILYPWLFAILLFLSAHSLVTITTLLFIAALASAALIHRSLEKGTFCVFWPLPVATLILWILQFFL